MVIQDLVAGVRLGVLLVADGGTHRHGVAGPPVFLLLDPQVPTVLEWDGSRRVGAETGPASKQARSSAECGGNTLIDFNYLHEPTVTGMEAGEVVEDDALQQAYLSAEAIVGFALAVEMSVW